MMSLLLGHLCHLLGAEPDLHECGEVLRHRLPAQVSQRVHRVPGQEGGGRGLDHGDHPGAPQELDPGDEEFLLHKCSLHHLL